MKRLVLSLVAVVFAASIAFAAEAVKEDKSAPGKEAAVKAEQKDKKHVKARKKAPRRVKKTQKAEEKAPAAVK